MLHWAKATAGKTIHTMLKIDKTIALHCNWKIRCGFIQALLKAIIWRNHDVNHNTCNGHVEPNWKCESRYPSMQFNFVSKT